MTALQFFAVAVLVMLIGGGALLFFALRGKPGQRDEQPGSGPSEPKDTGR